MLISLVVYN